MLWCYHCPSCGQELHVDWDFHREETSCVHCRTSHYPPTPREDHLAYFSGDKWPPEMTDAVISLRGTTCAVPGCFQNYSALSHRRALTEGGRTSVENLIPLCAEHARLKGLRNYDEWLKDLPSAPAPKPIEITITHRKSEPPPAAKGFAVGCSQIVAGLARPAGLPEGLSVILTAPFLLGAAQRLLLHYDWRLASDGASHLVLLAWPKPADAQEKPRFIRAGKEHKGKAGDSGTDFLELYLSGDPNARWTAVVATEPAEAGLVLNEYLLTLTD